MQSHCPTVSDPLCEGLGAEPGEHHVVCCSDPGAGQHGRHGQRTRRHVDGDAVPLLHAMPLQQVAQATCHLQQLPVER